MGRSPALKAQFRKFKRLPFPSNSTHEPLSILHGELVLLDTFAAGIVFTVAHGGRLSPDAWPIAKNLGALRERLEEIERSDDCSVRHDAQRYLEYVAELTRLLDLAIKDR